MKLAIHHRPGSFSDRWIEYCKNKGINFKIVNAFDSDIINQVKDCDVFLWHHHHSNFKDVLTAQRILFALEHAGISVFPDFRTAWHFDDKVAQKYLLEAIEAPLVPSYVFYDKNEAIEWVKNTSYPKVFKLKGGAGATNVKLVTNQTQAIKLVNKAFGKGFSQFDSWQNLIDRIEKYKNGKDTAFGVLKGIGRFLIKTDFAKQQCNEKGYVYFQDFIPNNTFDTRVVIVDNKAVAERRMVRKDDFRASGSGRFDYNDINIDCVKTAFDIAERLKIQSVAFDFVEDENNNPLIVEMSYGFGTKGIKKAPGYWDSNLRWYAKEFSPEQWILNCVMNH